VISFHGKEFELHPSNKGVSEELFRFGIHEPMGTECYLQYLSLGDHVLDVGSNIGYFLRVASEKIGPSGRFLGFEPAPDVHAILQRNVRRWGTENIDVFPWAIGARNETAEFHLSEIPNWGSLIHDDSLLQTRSTRVQVRRIDDLMREFPEFRPTVLRMDVEGGELQVLKGAREVLRQYRPTLFIEFHNSLLGWKPVRSTLIALRDLGYSSGVLIDRSWDHPWHLKWMRESRRWSGNIDALLRRIESSSNSLENATLGLILKRPDVR
jgi:FkbM family methyltransferase